MMPRHGLAALFLAAITYTPAAHAQFANKPALIYSTGGKADKSFNEAAFNGAEQYKKEGGGEYREFEITNPAQIEQALRNMARRGYTMATFIKVTISLYPLQDRLPM